jgi:ATP-binding protein involved in chromosome partitioning
MMTLQKLTNLLQTTQSQLLERTLNDMAIDCHLIENLQQLTVQLKAGFPLQSLAPSLITDLKNTLEKIHPGIVSAFEVNDFIRAHQTQLPGRGLRGVKNTIAVASGKGGVGKSTVAVNLAIALARAGASVGILDADIYGPSIPLMLGTRQKPILDGDKYLPVPAHGIVAMSIGYLTDSNQALIWRGPMLAKSLMHMLDTTLWHELDYLFIDLPPGTGDIQLSLVQKIPITGAIIVTTPQTVATLDAQKAIAMFQKTGIDVLGLIENMAMHTCSQCHHTEALFGQNGGIKLANASNISLLGQLPLTSRIGRDCDEGIPTASHVNDEISTLFMKIALTTAIMLAKKPINYSDKFPPIVVE